MKHSLLVKILTGTANQSEQAQFDAWLDESEQNKEYYNQLKTIWDKMDGVYNKKVFNEAAARIKIRSKIAERRTKTTTLHARAWISAAASILLMFGLGYLIVNHYQSSLTKSLVYQSQDKVSEVLLPDSTHVWLNANSTLSLSEHFSEKHRKVTLSGEAFFDVKRNKELPFQVEAGETTTKVLGTSFNVDLDKVSGDVSVIVESGRVAFYKSLYFWRKSVLTKNMKAQFIAETKNISVSEIKSQNYLSWKTGVLSFYDTPLRQVCKDLSNHYHKNITVKDQMADIPITGNFKDQSLDEILEIIEITLDAEISQSKHEIYISD